MRRCSLAVPCPFHRYHVVHVCHCPSCRGKVWNHSQHSFDSHLNQQPPGMVTDLRPEQVDCDGHLVAPESGFPPGREGRR